MSIENSHLYGYAVQGQLNFQEEEKPPRKRARKIKNRCAFCRKKLSLAMSQMLCKCEKKFCAIHRPSHMHACTYDFFSSQQRHLQKALPELKSRKLDKI